MAYVLKDVAGNTYYCNHNKTTVSNSYNVSYTSPGTYTWVCPEGVSSVSVEVAGAGGGYGWNCDCDCDCNCDCCSDDVCIISGKVLTDKGYVDIKELKSGMNVIDQNGTTHKVLYVVSNVVGKRKAIKVGNCVFTEEHAFMSDNKVCVTDIKKYEHSLKREIICDCGTAKYRPAKEVTVIDLEKYKVNEDTPTYTIVTSTDFIVMDGVIAACAK